MWSRCLRATTSGLTGQLRSRISAAGLAPSLSSRALRTSSLLKNANDDHDPAWAESMPGRFTSWDGVMDMDSMFNYLVDEQGNLRINLEESDQPSQGEITEAMVVEAQEAWGKGIVNISTAHMRGADYEQAARDHINNLYGYSEGKVLFKPTLARDQQFRDNFNSALSYFVAKNSNAPESIVAEDTGFAIKGWTHVRFENSEIIVSGNTAVAMGNYFFTHAGGVQKVEYTFGYFLDTVGKLRINLHHSALPYGAQVTTAMVEAAQKAWGDGIVKISAVHSSGGDFEKAAREHINNLYGYNQGSVLFKPTLAADAQFRGTFSQALSYFVAQNSEAPDSVHKEDTGFGIKGWTDVRFENTGIITAGNTATATGNYFFTNRDGITKVEYTFGYFLDEDDNLRINLHHSSLPYAPA